MTSTISRLLEESWTWQSGTLRIRKQIVVNQPRTSTEHAQSHAKNSITQGDHVMAITYFTSPSMKRGCTIHKLAVNRLVKHDTPPRYDMARPIDVRTYHSLTG
jgi:hypothetical protein